MKKNGFTLVEVLAVLVIIGILSAISVAIYTNSISSSKNTLSDFQKGKIKEAARTYVAINTINFNKIFNDNTIENFCIQIPVGLLHSEGFLPASIFDPKDNTELSGYVVVYYDTDGSQYAYKYIDNPKCAKTYKKDQTGNYIYGDNDCTTTNPTSCYNSSLKEIEED